MWMNFGCHNLSELHRHSHAIDNLYTLLNAIRPVNSFYVGLARHVTGTEGTDVIIGYRLLDRKLGWRGSLLRAMHT
jgi:hypothetical protein